MRELTQEQVRDAIHETVVDADSEFDEGTDRETLIEWLDQRCDDIWGQLVKQGRIDEYDADDLIETAAACGAILAVAKQDSWVEDDCGLWDGLTYGVLPSVAYYSLRNCLYSALKANGHDSNDDYPFREEDADLED